MGNITDEPDWSGFLKAAMDSTIPLNMHWDLTYRCDHKCVHCYLTDRHRDELSLEECEAVLDELVAAGTISILFSGGDLFLRPDALEILKAARDRQFDVRINTHGNFITESVADALQEMGVARVSISVYSENAEVHEAVTLIPGSHQKSLDGARRLIERGIAVVFKTPVMAQNKACYHTVGPLAARLGASSELDAHIVPDDQSDFGLCAVGVHSSERVLALIGEMLKESDSLPEWYELHDAPPTARTCSAGTSMGYISPDGILYPCLNWRDPIGDLRESSFRTLWKHSEAVEKQRQVTRGSYLSDCDGCGFNGKCHYCPGISHAEHGQPGRRSEYVCERTHVTMSAFEHAKHLSDTGQDVPSPGSPEARALLERSTFAERQWAARQAGMSHASDRVRPIGQLVQIGEPTR